MRLILFDRNKDLCEAWLAFFDQDKDSTIDIVQGELEHIIRYHNFQAIVSPANSFGIMDGGIDKPLAEAFPPVRRNVYSLLKAVHGGYLPVGSTDIVETGDSRHPLMIVAPTMPYPRALADPFVVYDVMRSLLKTAENNGVESIAIPGLATATGKVPHDVAAKLMYAAWAHHVRGDTTCANWAEADLVLAEVLGF